MLILAESEAGLLEPGKARTTGGFYTGTRPSNARRFGREFLKTKQNNNKQFPLEMQSWKEIKMGLEGQ